MADVGVQPYTRLVALSRGFVMAPAMNDQAAMLCWVDRCALIPVSLQCLCSQRWRVDVPSVQCGVERLCEHRARLCHSCEVRGRGVSARRPKLEAPNSRLAAAAAAAGPRPDQPTLYSELWNKAQGLDWFVLRCLPSSMETLESSSLSRC